MSADDKSYFEYYNIAWQFAVFIVTFNPSKYFEFQNIISEAIVIEDYIKYFNIQHNRSCSDELKVLFEVEDEILQIAFMLSPFKSYIKQKNFDFEAIYNSDGKRVYTSKYGRLDEVAYHKIKVFNYSNNDELITVSATVNGPGYCHSYEELLQRIKTKATELLTIVNDSNVKGIDRKLDTSLHKDHPFWLLASETFNSRTIRTKKIIMAYNNDVTIIDHKVGAFSPTERSNEMKEYIDGLILKSWHLVETYASIENIPTLKERFELVNEKAPRLYNHILKLITSETYENQLKSHANQYQESGEYSQDYIDANIYYCQRNSNNKARVVSFIETLAYANRKQNIVTPAAVIEGVLNMLGKLSYSSHNIKSAKKHCISAKSARKILKKWIESIVIKNMSKIDTNINDRKKFVLHNIDNYVQIFWGKYKGNDSPFTVQVPSIARLVCPVDRIECESDSIVYLYPSLSNNNDWKNNLKAIIKSGRIVIPAQLRDCIDSQGLKYQGLGDWFTLGNMNAKSSKRYDILDKVINEYLIGICHLDKVEQGIIVDSEFILHFNVISYSDPDIIKNLAVFLCTFHLRMHIIQNLFTDPVSLLLIYLPYLYECKKLQQDKVLLLAKSLVKNMSEIVQNHKPLNQNDDELEFSNNNIFINSEKNEPVPGMKLDLNDIKESLEKYEQIHDKKPLNIIELLNNYIPLKNAYYSANFRDDIVEKDANYEDDIEFDDTDNTDNTLSEAQIFVNRIIDQDKTSSSLFNDSGWADVIKLVQKFIAYGYRDGNRLHSYKDKQKHLINYARLMFAVQQFIDCYNELLNDEADSEFKQLMFFEDENSNTKSFPIRYSHDQIKNGMYGYGIAPLQDIVNKGSGILMIESLIDMTKYLASKDRSKVCRSLLVLIYLYDHYFKNRLDIGELILTNISKMNNQNVEDFNSLVSRIGSKNAEASFENLKNDSLLVEVNTKIKSSEREQIGLKTISSSNFRGEIIKQENFHLTQTKSQDDKPATKLWIKNHFNKLNEAAANCDYSVDTEKFSIASSILKGSEILTKEKVGEIDKYYDYLEKDKVIQEKVRQSRDARDAVYDNNTDYHILNSKLISVSMLQGFILFLNPNSKNLPYSSLNKAQLVKKIIDVSSIEDFIAFLSENNINSRDSADAYLVHLKKLRKDRIGTKRVTNDYDDEDELLNDDDDEYEAVFKCSSGKNSSIEFTKKKRKIDNDDGASEKKSRDDD